MNSCATLSHDIPSRYEIATAMGRRNERRPTNVSVGARKMGWMREKIWRVVCLVTLCAMSSPGMSQETQNTSVADSLRPYVESGAMPGFVTMVISPEATLDTTVLGYANVDPEQPMREDTLFWIASMSKTLTATAVLTLVDEGKITLDDPIDRFYPEFARLRVAVPQENGDTLLVKANSVPTVRQVMSHTAGLPFITPFMDRFGIDAMPLERKMQDIVDTPLNSQPGTNFEYSNLGIDIGAAIVEKVAGKKFEVYCQERIFDPLGMTHTTWFPTEEQLSNYATSYGWDDATQRLSPVPIRYLSYPLSDTANRFSDGGGGLFSTAGDIAKLYQMLLRRGELNGQRILSENAIDLISQKQTGLDTAYGLGTFLGGEGDFGHGGAHATDARVFPKYQIAIVYMVQVAGVPKQNEAKQAFDQAVRTLVQPK